MFGNHGLCGLLEEGAHGKSPKCLGGNLGDFGGILQRSQLVKVLHFPAPFWLISEFNSRHHKTKPNLSQ